MYVIIYDKAIPFVMSSSLLNTNLTGNNSHNMQLFDFVFSQQFSTAPNKAAITNRQMDK
jgi:hypothetical protein